MTTVLLLAATGRTGKLVLQNLLDLGHRVRVLVRDRNKVVVQHQNLTILQGSTLDAGDMKNALQGCEVVVSVLNISRKSDFPWSALRTPTDFLSGTMRNLLANAAGSSVRKIVICSAWGASETKQDIPGWFRWFIDNSNIGPAYKDHERQELLLKASGFPFVIVRPVGLTNFKKPRPVRVSINNQPKPSLTISRGDAATFIAAQVEQEDFAGRAVTISSDN